MPRRTRDQILAEHARLSTVFETAIDILCEIDPAWQANRHLILTRDQALAAVAAGRATPSEILRGLQAGLNDLMAHPDFADPERDPVGALLAARYRERTGRSLLADAGDPRKTIARILKRNRIRNETEAQLLMEMLNDTGRTALPPADYAAANRLIAAFESAGAS